MGQDDSCHLSRPFKIPQVLLYLLQLLSLDKMASLSSAFPTVSAKVWRTGRLLFLHLSNMIWKSLLVIIFTFRRSTKFSLLSKLHELVLYFWQPDEHKISILFIFYLSTTPFSHFLRYLLIMGFPL